MIAFKIKPKSDDGISFIIKLDSYCIPGYQNESSLSRFDKFIDKNFVGSEESFVKTGITAAINENLKKFCTLLNFCF